MMRFAFIDESARHRAREDTCVYTLAAVIVDDAAVDAVRDAMNNLRYRGNATVHWRKERAERRKLIAAAVAELPVEAVVTVCMHASDMKAERARRLCMKRLLAHLSELGADDVTFESRHAQQDQADRDMLTGLRRERTVRADMRVSWMLPSEPILWAADVFASALSWWLDDQGDYWTILEPQVTLIDIDP
jgi:hypothetical protein